MSDALWMPDRDVAGTQATIAANKRWQSRLFTTSGTWTVPADVGVIWIDGCAGGGGGGGGDPTPGGGGGGGCAGDALSPPLQMPCAPGETLTLTIGAGGAGGAAGAAGSLGGATIMSGTLAVVRLNPATGVGAKGNGTAGGTGGAFAGGNPSGGAGGANGLPGGSGNVRAPGITYTSHPYLANLAKIASGSGGGGLVANGGNQYAIDGSGPLPVSTGSASGGGGGRGGGTPWGDGGKGGAGGAAGANATGYGAGGGGGGGNAPGGNGSPGFIRIYCFSATTI